ncbi:MAG: hypothetical protein H6953_11505 [Chromatiaceae bacterium]|nr:hypothetical protein [Chromatiaceae bacterium]MCP5316024.1 hypothetical protein [Chromatiaceae bacterium]
MDLSTILTTASAAYAQIETGLRLIGEMRKITDSIDDANLKLTIAELMNSLVESKSQNVALKAELLELQQQVAVEKELLFKKGVYWRQEEPVPFCPVCWDERKRLIHLVTDHESSFDPRHHCNVCKNVFRVNPDAPTPKLPAPDHWDY